MKHLIVIIVGLVLVSCKKVDPSVSIAALERVEESAKRAATESYEVENGWKEALSAKESVDYQDSLQRLDGARRDARSAGAPEAAISARETAGKSAAVASMEVLKRGLIKPTEIERRRQELIARNQLTDAKDAADAAARDREDARKVRGD